MGTILTLLHIAWIDFFYIFFWFIIIIFLVCCYDLLIIIMYSEIVWVILYSYIAISGIINDDPILITTTLLVMSFAGLEFCTGFILSIFFKNFKKSFTTIDNFKINKKPNAVPLI